MVNTGSSPAEIVEFEEEVNNRSMKTDYKSGFKMPSGGYLAGAIKNIPSLTNL